MAVGSGGAALDDAVGGETFAVELSAGVEALAGAVVGAFAIGTGAGAGPLAEGAGLEPFVDRGEEGGAWFFVGVAIDAEGLVGATIEAFAGATGAVETWFFAGGEVGAGAGLLTGAVELGAFEGEGLKGYLAGAAFVGAEFLAEEAGSGGAFTGEAKDFFCCGGVGGGDAGAAFRPALLPGRFEGLDGLESGFLPEEDLAIRAR